MFDVIVAGELNPDLILTGDVAPRFDQIEQRLDRALLTIGSSSAIFACGAARLGLKTAFIGLCGDDVFGRFMLDGLLEHGVDISNIIVRPGQTTGLSVILIGTPDRAILTLPGLIPELRAADISDALLQQARHLHVASYYLQTNLQAGLPGLFERAHGLGLTTSLDTNYDPSAQWAPLNGLLPLTDVFLPNGREAIALTRLPEAAQAALKLATQAGTVAVKLGKAGAIAAKDGLLVRSGSIPVKLVDAVGAGDSFDAGFLYGFLHQWDLERTLQLACACGALSVQQSGGTDGQPTLEEALRRLPG